jgi:hypothetical protein
LNSSGWLPSSGIVCSDCGFIGEGLSWVGLEDGNSVGVGLVGLEDGGSVGVGLVGLEDGGSVGVGLVGLESLKQDVPGTLMKTTCEEFGCRVVGVVE